jgi:hypothetical protein
MQPLLNPLFSHWSIPLMLILNLVKKLEKIALKRYDQKYFMIMSQNGENCKFPLLFY